MLKDWQVYPLYQTPSVIKLSKNLKDTVDKLGKTIYQPSDFSHFDNLGYGGTRNVNGFMERYLSDKRNLKVLDLCTGCGAAARFLVYKYHCDLVALDYIEGFNELNRMMNHLCGLDNISVFQGDASEFDHSAMGCLGDRDLVYCIQSALHIANKDGFATMINRALKVGGLIYIEDHAIQNPEPMDEMELEACESVAFMSKLTTADYTSLFERHGFQIESVNYLTRHFSECLYELINDAFKNREQIVRDVGESGFDSIYTARSKTTLRFYHDLGLTVDEVKEKYPYLTAGLGESFVEKWIGNTTQKVGGIQLVARKVRDLD